MTELQPNEYRKILKILQNITLESSIQNLALLKYDGTCLAFFSELIEGQFEIQVAISSMISSISTSARLVCNRFNLGDPREVIIRGSKGYTIFFISEYILVGGGNDVRALGITKRVMNYYFPMIYGVIYPEWARQNNLIINF